MTNDEKAKAYEMALEAARKELGVDRKEWEVVEQVLKSIFPELRESEDERIRKGLIRHLEELRDWNCGTMSPIRVSSHYDAWISYLEKQKEPHIPWYDYQKSKEAGYTIVPNEEYEQLIKQKEQKKDNPLEDFSKGYNAGYYHGRTD